MKDISNLPEKSLIMFPNMQKYLEVKSKNIPTIEVSYEEFIKIMMQNNHTKE